MKCFKCGAMLPNGTKYCVMCGTNLQAQNPQSIQTGTKSCPRCGFLSAAGASFCKFCGAPLRTPLNMNDSVQPAPVPPNANGNIPPVPVPPNANGNIPPVPISPSANGNIPPAPVPPSMNDSVQTQEPRLTLINMDKYIGDKGIGLSEGCGILKIYPDRIEFDSSQGKSGSIFSKALKKKNTGANTLEVYGIGNIKACYYSKFMSSIPAVLLEMADGTLIKFARAARANEVKEAVILINRLRNPSIGSVTQSVNAPAPINISQPEPEKKDYSVYDFVMEISNYITVDEQYIAIIGSVVKGRVSKGNTLYVTGKDGSSKGSFEVKSIAVDKKIADSAAEGSSDTAFLCNFPGYLLKFGDIISA